MTTQLLLTAGLLAASTTLFAQKQNPPFTEGGISFNSYFNEYNNSFDSDDSNVRVYLGTQASLPAGVTTSAQPFRGIAGGASATAPGYYALQDSKTSFDHSLGMVSEGTNPLFYEFTFRNGDAAPITSLILSYKFEQYSFVGNGGITVTSSLGDVSSLSQSGSATQNGSGTNARLKFAFLDVNIASGTTFTLRFAASGTAGANNAVGADDVSITANYNLPLPVQLTAFEATPEASGANLAWTTASEKDNAFFGVEMSRDGITFEEVGRVSGAGNSTELQNYVFSVAGLSAGQHYFRLAQNDYDGVVRYSPIASLRIDGKGKGKGFSILANYAQEELQLTSDDAGTATIVDVSGRVLRQVRLVPGRQELNVSDLATGMYFLSNGETTVRFVK